MVNYDFAGLDLDVACEVFGLDRKALERSGADIPMYCTDPAAAGLVVGQIAELGAEYQRRLNERLYRRHTKEGEPFDFVHLFVRAVPLLICRDALAVVREIRKEWG